MNRGFRSWVTAFGITLFLATAGHAAPVSTCNSFSLPVAGPLWTSSATWVAERSQLATIDTIQNRIFVFSADGKLVPLDDPQLSPQGNEKFYPVYLIPTKDGYLLKLVGNEALLLDGKLQVRSRIDLAKTSKGAKSGLRSFYQLVVVGDRLFSYGSIASSEPGKPYKLGFFLSPLKTRDTVSTVLPFDSGDFYVLGHPYLTGLGSDAYFLLMKDEIRIFRVPADQPSKPAPLQAFPDEFRSLPTIKTPMTGPETAAALFAEIESYSMPVGLYGFNDFLYLLTRQPKDGHTSWSLFKIDPRGDRIVDQLMLPTTADTHHVSLVFSDEFIFILEKGQVQADGRQKTNSITRIPAAWLTESATSPINVKSSRLRGVSLCQTVDQR